MGKFVSRDKILDYGLPLLILVIGVIYCLLNPVTSPIDELQHFSYINYIIIHKELPTVYTNYEAVHPPLYYLLMALLGSFFTNGITFLFAIRIFGAVCLALSSLLILKTLRLFHFLESPLQCILGVSLVALATLNPGILVRSTTVSNEALLILLTSLFLYYFCKFPLGSKIEIKLREIDLGDVLVLGVLSAACILTKFNSVILTVLAGAYFLIDNRNNWKTATVKILSFGGIVLLLVLPWIVFNLLTYGELTGMNLHLFFVMPLVNPENVVVTMDSLIQKLPKLIQTFWFPQEWSWTKYNFLSTMLFTGYTLSFFALVLNSCVSIIRQALRARKSTRKFSFDPKQGIFLACSFLILLSILSVTIFSYRVDDDFMIGRYFYFIIQAFVLSSIISIKQFVNEEAYFMMIVINIGAIILFNLEYFFGVFI